MPFKKPAWIAVGAVLLFFGVISSAFGEGRSWWRKVNVNHPGQICGVAMSPSGQHIVFSGDFTAHSSDRGVTWEMVNSSPPIMIFGDETHLFSVGSSQDCGIAGMLRSTNYGQTWSGTSAPPICFSEIFFVDSLYGWAVGDKDFIVKTEDGGKTLQTEPYGLSGFTGGVSFFDSLQGFVAGWLVGADSSVLRTTNGGSNWDVIPVGIFSLVGMSIDFVDSVNGWLVGATGSRKLYRTTDGGQSWVEQSPLGGFGFIEKVDAVDSLNAWVLANASNPRVWRTTDAGQSWVLEYDQPGGSLLDFVMVDDTQGVAVGNLGNVIIYAPAILGDLDGDRELTATDVILELNKVFLDTAFSAPLEAGDLNCDSVFDSEDVVLLLNGTFLGIPFPCSL